MMSTPEFFGVFIGFAGAICAVLFMGDAYRNALHRHIHRMRFCLKFAGCLSLASWLVMALVVFQYNKKCDILQSASTFRSRQNPDIIGQGIVKAKTYTAKTPLGVQFSWEYDYGMRGRGRGSQPSGNLSRRSIYRDGERHSNLQLPGDSIDGSGHGSSSLPRDEPENRFRI